MITDDNKGPKGAAVPANSYANDIIIGNSVAAHSLRQMAALAAGSDSPILITGPRGCGKETAARAIHAASARRNGPFIKVNCAAQSSENFLTRDFQASQDTQSKPDGGLENAHLGTLYLSDIDEMCVDVQFLTWRLLALQPTNRAPEPFGPALDIRVLAATSQSIARKVSEGTFRQDLYYRLSSLTLPVPPLRQRREDIAILIDYFVLEHAPDRRFTTDWAAQQALCVHSWPGNIRELRNLVARTCAFHPGQIVGAHQMRSLLAMGQARKAESTKPTVGKVLGEDSPIAGGFSLKMHLADEELRYLQSALEQAKGIVQHAADITGMKRTTFLEKMRRHAMERRQYRR
jgi:sigma-54 specific flagellar transcriptional regulator A